MWHGEKMSFWGGGASRQSSKYHISGLKTFLKLGIIRPIILPQQFINKSINIFDNSLKKPFFPSNWPEWSSHRVKSYLGISVFVEIYQTSTKIKIKCRPFQSNNLAQILAKPLQSSFDKIQKTPFLAPKMVTMTLTQGKKLTLNLDFRVHMLNF